MSKCEFDLDLAELSSAEDFLDYFNIAYDQSVVQVNRLHILQRFHDYIHDVDEDEMPQSGEEKRELYAGLLNRAYSDFVKSDALTEKVFKVFHMHEPVSVEIPLTDFREQVSSSAPKV
jgi:nitrogenase-stabilizing/protective protein